MGHIRRTGARRARRSVALLLLLGVAAGACAGGDDDEVGMPASSGTDTTAAPGSTAAPPCSESRHAVVLDFVGTLTLETDFEAVVAVDLEVLPRPGVVEVVAAYQDLGYEIVYATTAPADAPVGDARFADALTVWLADNGLPLGDRARVWAWDGSGDAVMGLLEELVRLEQAGVSVDAAYTDSADNANAMASGGVPPEGLWTLGEAAGAAGGTAVPGDDLAAHVATVEQLGPVCRPA